jgi:hypothetical protein
VGLRLTTLDGRFAIARLPADAAVPRWAVGQVVAVTRTPDELSVICAERPVPEATPAERGWRCLQVQGPLDFEMTGVLAALSGPLADARIPLLAFSTYDTDYLLIREGHLEAAHAALERAGHRVDRAADHTGSSAEDHGSRPEDQPGSCSEVP